MLIGEVFIRSAVRIIPAFFLMILAHACASGPDYLLLNKQINEGNCQLASESIDIKRYGLNMRLNFLLDSAIVNMRCGNYEESNNYLHQADELAEKLWTKSLTKQAASYLVNDYTIPYRGEDYEKAFINLFSSINYVLLGDLEEALVECRRLDSLLTLYNEKYKKKNVYKEDAFGRYLSGIIYEADRNMEDAYIDYFKAYQTFQDYEKNYGTKVPSLLIKDLIRAGKATGRQDEISSIKAEHEALDADEAGQSAKIVLIQLNGKAPVKKEDKIFVLTSKGPLSLAFPRYELSKPACSKSRMIVKGSSENKISKLELVEDVNRIALKSLSDRKLRITAKALVRLVAKQAALEQITGDKDAQRVLNIINAAVLDRADTRSWRTLPGEIYMSYQFVHEGRYGIYADYCGRENFIGDVTVKAGETKFLLFDTIQ
ncbi:MAG: hypothetical protein IMF07_04185 [Proteobacteria bacterium]|nr:hypothetical protein [Pseudomonadota bacterium]